MEEAVQKGQSFFIAKFYTGLLFYSRAEDKKVGIFVLFLDKLLAYNIRKDTRATKLASITAFLQEKAIAK